MKWARFLLPLVLLFGFAGCFDIDEEIDVKTNGSGEWKMNIDMSQLVDIMQTYMGKEELEKQLPQRKMDTTLHMKDLIDTVSGIPADKKALLREGQVHVQLNMDEKIFKTNTEFPFKNVSDLEKLRNVAGSNSFGAGKLLKGFGGDKSGGDSSQGPDLSMFGSIYEFRITDGQISSKLNKPKWDSLQNNPQFAQIKAAGGSGIDVPYSMTIRLPRPVKKADNPIIKLSEDKKTVTIKYNLMDTFQQPEKFEYSISY
ncbi:MAG TPA: hypothetical protein VKR32_00375 [Puia sp.]|nr:hypothetical protein [Puia sp.]